MAHATSTAAAPTNSVHVRPAACRCELVLGRSAKLEVTFAGRAESRERVGAAPDSDWWLEGPGAPELALELLWDGELLWAADRADHGQATVDGERLGKRWRGLAGRCRLAFPGGAILVDSSRPGVVVERAPRCGAADEPPPSGVRTLEQEAAGEVDRADWSHMTLQGLGPEDLVAEPPAEPPAPPPAPPPPPPARTDKTIPLTDADLLLDGPPKLPGAPRRAGGDGPA